jgi:uncharacterized membrane protein YhiD involved in acid resistance
MKVLIALGLVILAIVGSAIFGLFGRWFDNTVDYAGRRIDDRTRYETRRQVEDTCRAMMASFTADRLTYEQYKDSENAEQQGWASQARMRANRTAATYNEYILKNSYVWEGNIPADIKQELEYIE